MRWRLSTYIHKRAFSREMGFCDLSDYVIAALVCAVLFSFYYMYLLVGAHSNMYLGRPLEYLDSVGPVPF